MAGMGTDICYLTIGEASASLRRRELSPVELTQAFLERIEAVDGQLHSFITVLRDQALAEARAAEAEILRGHYRGPLHGIPIALKDLYDTAGVPTTCASRLHMNRVPAEDAMAVARLRAAGTVLLGKLMMLEFALGGNDPDSPFPPARNPWNLDHKPGGSSSGSAAAVAAGLCMGSLGSCSGGSIRNPAAQCGIVGLKPTYGLVSRHGVVPLSWSLDHCGPMTWTVEDTALMLQAIAGHDPKDPTTSTTPVPDYSLALKEDVRDLTIGVPRDFFFAPSQDVDPELQATVQRALAALEELGAHLEEVSIPSLEYSRAADSIIMLADGYAIHQRDLNARPQEYGDTIRALFRMGALFSAGDYVQANRVRQLMKRECAEVLERVDVLVTPTLPQPAAPFQGYDRPSVVPSQRFTPAFNLTGLPAISVPAGFTSAGLPVGMQIVGKPFDEATVLRVAYTYERYAGWFQRRPPI